MNYLEQIKQAQDASRAGKARSAPTSGWLAKRRSVRFKAICRLLRVWAQGGWGVGGGGIGVLNPNLVARH